jgi:hypothetical protein
MLPNSRKLWHLGIARGFYGVPGLLRRMRRIIHAVARR